LRYAVDHRDRNALRDAEPRYLAVFARSRAVLEALAETLSNADAQRIHTSR